MHREIKEPWGRRLHAALPDGAAGQWCSIDARAPGREAWWAKLELTDEARGQVVREVFLGPARQGGRLRRTLVHVPVEARAVTLLVFGGTEGAPVSLRVTPRSRRRAAASLLWQGRAALPRILRGAPSGLPGRARATLGQGPARAGEAPPYASWLLWFADAPLSGQADWPVQVAILGGGADLARQTLASLAAQRGCAEPPQAVIIESAEDWRRITAPWVILMEAGDVLTPWAVRHFADAARAAPDALFLTADCDRLGPHGRCDPLFKPGPDPRLLDSALPVQGACAVLWRDVPAGLPVPHRAACLAFATARREAMAHVPHLLCSVLRPYGVAPVPAMPAGPMPAIRAIIPSALRSAHVAHCLGRIARDTGKQALHLVIVASDLAGADNRVRRAVESLAGAQVISGPPGPFNFSSAVNTGAALADGAEFLLLLNDDVAPCAPGWLPAMVAEMRDPRVGIVGARLLYGNGTVQHEGVIMGLANLCEHAGRLRDGADAGSHGIGALTRQVSAVTAACMLVRRTVFDALGGMDPAYAIALNDVDFCLRARAAGWRVVYAAEATLFHYESLSLGRHYAGVRAGLETLEVRRLRAAWPDAIAADPFYNRQAALQPGREWQPAFPPRPPLPVVCPANTLAGN